jgi:hypothetical protein
VKFGTWGPRFLVSPANALGFFWPWIFAALVGPDKQLVLLFLFWIASIPFLMLHGIVGIWRRRRGYKPHSRYWGDCWGQAGGSIREQRWARQKMSLLILVVSAIGFTWVPPLGAMLMASVLAKMISDAIAFDAIQIRMREMDDARIESSFYLQEYRQRNDFE